MVERLSPLEHELQVAAGDLHYPQTPPIVQNVIRRLNPPATAARPVRRKLLWSMVLLVAFVAALMLVPPVRAAVLAWIQIGAVRILPPAPTSIPAGLPEAPPLPELFPVTATSAPSSLTPTAPSLLDLAGEMTLAEAQARLDFPILVPSGLQGLGLPERVYLQDMGGPMLVLVWLDPADPQRVRLSLHTLSSKSWAIQKAQPKVIQQVTINGQPGVWVEGPYFLQLRNQDFELTRLIEGHVLIWTQAGLTYRLETGSTLEEALLIAGSLAPLPAGTP
ncbi:MAG TPA: hypothetical protein VGK00_13310 [Anaerolineales bacterium]|jgi:hypothetical protein